MTVPRQSQDAHAPSLARLPCVCTVFLLLQAQSAAAAALSAGPPYPPGDSNYWVNLKTIGVSQGSLQPAFDGERSEYELHLHNSNTKDLVLSLGLDLNMYSLLHTPRIYFDGVEVKYSPLNVITVSVPLNETIGPLKKTVTVQVADPSRAYFFSLANSKTYWIHITQPPDFEKVVEAESITVTDAKGMEVVSVPPFSPSSLRSSFRYQLQENQTEVFVKVQCTKFATGTYLDEQTLESGDERRIDLSHRVESRSLAQCKYQDPVWAPTLQMQSYSLIFTRDTKMTGATPKLSMLADFGYCTSRSAYEAKLGEPLDNLSATEGFVCVSDRPRPRMLVSMGDEEAEVYLQGKDRRVPMPNFLPVEIAHVAGRQNLKLLKHAGRQKLEYPVTMIWPAACESYTCPKRFVSRHTESAVLEKKHMCVAETCSTRDVGICCERLGTCSSLMCPKGMQLKAHAEEIDCAAPDCTEQDVSLCCEAQATCEGYTCSALQVLRHDAADRYCGARTCGPREEPLCCAERASCRTYDCPAASVRREVRASRLCQSEVCETHEGPYCCLPHATCSSFVCPAGLRRQAGSEDVECENLECGQKDVNRCCEDTSGIRYQTGRLEAINEDGSYRVRFSDSGKVDAEVPEWALRGGQNHSNLHPGEEVEVSVGKHGYVHRNYIFGWVQAVHLDGTYTVAYESGEVDKQVPSWALRAVDEKGHLFVHSELFTEGERVLASRTSQGYHHEEFSIASVVAVNEDDSYTVRYASGKTDEHVPGWDLRAIDQHGRSYASTTHDVGDTVEVNLGDKDSGLEAHRDQLRTKYLLGRVTHANPNGTYVVHYDFGGKESAVPAWAMQYLDKNYRSSFRTKYAVGDRVEARVSMGLANNLTGWGIEALGIATREKVVMYRQLGCWPEASSCSPAVAQENTPSIPKIPALSGYDVVTNPDGVQLCYYDEDCENSQDVSCTYDAARPMCRFCGFGDFPSCPRPRVDCSQGFPSSWTEEQRGWCCAHYNVGCPYECRWGKWWPGGVNGWGPWWSEEKREWCCKEQKIGCLPQEPAVSRNATQHSAKAESAKRQQSQADEEDTPKQLTTHKKPAGLAFKYETVGHKERAQARRAGISWVRWWAPLTGVTLCALVVSFFVLMGLVAARTRRTVRTARCRVLEREVPQAGNGPWGEDADIPLVA